MLAHSGSRRLMARRRPQAGEPAGARIWPRILVFLLLLCFVAQGTAVQSHVHFSGDEASIAAASGNGPTQLARPAKGHAPAVCPLCQEAAMAGAYVLASAPALPPPPAPLLWAAPARLAPFALLTPSLGWRSRAPPA